MSKCEKCGHDPASVLNERVPAYTVADVERLVRAAHFAICESNGIVDNEWRLKDGDGTAIPDFPVDSWGEAMQELEEAMTVFGSDWAMAEDPFAKTFPAASVRTGRSPHHYYPVNPNSDFCTCGLPLDDPVHVSSSGASR